MSSTENIRVLRELFGEQGLALIIDSSGDALCIQDRDFKVLYQNKAHVNIVGECRGQHCYNAFHGLDAVCSGCPVDRAFRDGEVHRGENSRTSDRGTTYVEITASPVRDVEGRTIAVIETVRDITARKNVEEKLRVLSNTDELTGLYNRRGFFFLAEQQLRLAYRQKKGLIIHLIDVDSLKMINDTLGHHEGDLVLVQTAAILKECFRESDIIARVGGDEFVVLQGDSAENDSSTPARRLRQKLQEHNTRKNRSYDLSMSIGTAYCDLEMPYSIDDLLAMADAKMYEQKKKRTNNHKMRQKL